MARGIHESGCGCADIIAASAKTSHPVSKGLADKTSERSIPPTRCLRGWRLRLLWLAEDPPPTQYVRGWFIDRDKGSCADESYPARHALTLGV